MVCQNGSWACDRKLEKEEDEGLKIEITDL